MQSHNSFTLSFHAFFFFFVTYLSMLMISFLGSKINRNGQVNNIIGIIICIEKVKMKQTKLQHVIISLTFI